MKYLSVIVLLLLAISASAQTGSQRVHIVFIDPPTACIPGHLYTNALAQKEWMGSSTSTCVQIIGTGGSSATTGANTFTGRQIISVNGASAAPPLSLTGTIFTGGGTTNTKPAFLVEPTGASSVGWSNNGTLIGANAPSGFAGDILHLKLDGANRLTVSNAGSLSAVSSILAGAALFLGWTGRSLIAAPSDGAVVITNSSATAGSGSLTVGNYNTGSNCSDSAGAAACGSASAGSVVMDAAATTVVVSTTAVTANSQIFIQEDSSLGTRLSVTCNTTTGRDFTVTARTAATSFTITSSAAPVTNPGCLSFRVVN